MVGQTSCIISLVLPFLETASHIKLNTVGFVKGCSPADAEALLKEAIRKRRDDGGNMVILARDILTAFNAMRHASIDEAFHSDLDVDTLIAIMKQYHHKHAYLTIPGAGDTDVFPFTRGGWQSGINIPDLLN